MHNQMVQNKNQKEQLLLENKINMKRLIRNGVFETNSSSNHSMSLSQGNIVYGSISPDWDGVIELNGGEYGWQTEKHNSAVFKANYLAQAYKDSNSLTETLISVIEKHTGAKVSINLDEDGYVDHESVGRFDDLTEEEIKRLIFDKNSWIFLGNDNNPASKRFFINDTYNEDGSVTKPDYKYRLVIGNQTEIYEYIKYPKDREVRESIEEIMKNGILVENGLNDYPEMAVFVINNESDKCAFYLRYPMPLDFDKKEIYLIRDDWRQITERMANKHILDLGIDVDSKYRDEFVNSLKEDFVQGLHPFFSHIVKFKIIEI